MDWMLMPLRRYADFAGRSRRKEYWMFTLGIFITFVALTLVLGVSGTGGEPSGLAVAVLVLASLAIIIPSVAVQVRRFHDQDKSGWMVLLAFIPFVGGIIVLVFMCLEGTRGDNRFGSDPKLDDAPAIA